MLLCKAQSVFLCLFLSFCVHMSAVLPCLMSPCVSPCGPTGPPPLAFLLHIKASSQCSVWAVYRALMCRARGLQSGFCPLLASNACVCLCVCEFIKQEVGLIINFLSERRTPRRWMGMICCNRDKCNKADSRGFGFHCEIAFSRWITVGTLDFFN